MDERRIMREKIAGWIDNLELIGCAFDKDCQEGNCDECITKEIFALIREEIKAMDAVDVDKKSILEMLGGEE